MSALPPEAAEERTSRQVRDVPKAVAWELPANWSRTGRIAHGFGRCLGRLLIGLHEGEDLLQPRDHVGGLKDFLLLLDFAP